MIGRLNHVAIAVPDLAAAAAQYRDTLGARVGAPQDEPEHGVTVVFVELPNTKVELLHPSGRGLADRRLPGEEPGGRDPSHLLRGRGHRGGARPAPGAGRAGARGRPAEDRRARQAGAVPASEGLRRHARRAGGGMNVVSALVLFTVIWFLTLLWRCRSG